jgi:hypothetical protein
MTQPHTPDGQAEPEEEVRETTLTIQAQAEEPPSDGAEGLYPNPETMAGGGSPPPGNA